MPISLKGVEQVEYRSWTSRSGAAVEAAFNRVEGSRAFFTRPDGSVIDIELSALSDADRALVTKLARGTVNRASLDKLPIFADGSWRGMNMVYQAEKYRAWVKAEGFLYIQPRSDGQDVGPVLWHRIRAYRIDKTQVPSVVYRPVVEFTDAPAPIVVETRNHEIRLTGKMADNVAFDELIQFDPDRIKLHAEVKDPPGLRLSSIWGFALYFPRSVEPDSERTLAQLKNMLEGWTLTLKTEKDGRETYPFWKALTTITRVVEATVKGPWGGRAINVQMPPAGRRDKRNYSVFNIYQNMSPADGFNLSRRMEPETNYEVDYVINID